jgi:hypothetical protein
MVVVSCTFHLLSCVIRPCNSSSTKRLTLSLTVADFGEESANTEEGKELKGEAQCGENTNLDGGSAHHDASSHSEVCTNEVLDILTTDGHGCAVDHGEALIIDGCIVCVLNELAREADDFSGICKGERRNGKTCDKESQHESKILDGSATQMKLLQ